MNKFSLDNFRKDVKKIQEYLRHIQLVDSFTDYEISRNDRKIIKTKFSDLKNHYKNFGTDKKIFEYKASIISLYGLLEKYVESWVKEYLDSLNILIPDYSQIDQTIRDKHFELSLKLMHTILSRESPKFQDITKEKVLKKLNECIVNPINYQFNTDAFVLSSGNLKHARIVNLFQSLSIDLNAGLDKNKVLNQYWNDEFQVHNISNMRKGRLYRPEVLNVEKSPIKSSIIDSLKS